MWIWPESGNTILVRGARFLFPARLGHAVVRGGHVVSAIAACAENTTKISPFEFIFIVANST